MKILKIIVFLIIVLLPYLLFSQGYVCAVGGGTERYHDWSDGPYGWMVEKANNGKFINIDVDGASEWYPNYFKYLGAADDSRALKIATKAQANSDEIYNELKTASGIFIEGGDQYDYVSTWKGTKVEQAILEIFQAGGVIGGTSAGLAVLGEVDFDAKYGSAYPQYCTYNAYNQKIHYEDNFLKLLPAMFTDSHFTMRGRLGRFVPMLARYMQDNPATDILGLGVDVNTAICVGPDLIAEVFGEATVTVLYKTENSQISCVPGQPPYFTNIGYDQLIEGCVYDMSRRTLIEAGPYLNDAGLAPETPTYNPITLNGSDQSAAEKGSYVIGNLFSNQAAVFYGNLTQREGDNIVPNAIIMPKIWNDRDYFENRLGGAQWGVASHPHFAAIIIDDDNTININENGILTTDNIVHILDTYGIQYSGLNSRGCQIPGILGAKLHFLTKDTPYDLKNHQPIVSAVEKKSMRSMEQNFKLFQNYPNPFNNQTKIRFFLNRNAVVHVIVCNQNGEHISTLFEGELSAGNHTFFWQGKNQSGTAVASGVYFLKITGESFHASNKMIYLK